MPLDVSAPTENDAADFEAVAEKMDWPALPPFDLPPFVRHIVPDRRDATAFDWWHVNHSGNAAADFALGVRFNGLAVALARKIERPDVLALIVTAIVLRGEIDSVEAGFLVRPLLLAYATDFH